VAREPSLARDRVQQHQVTVGVAALVEVARDALGRPAAQALAVHQHHARAAQPGPAVGAARDAPQQPRAEHRLVEQLADVPEHQLIGIDVDGPALPAGQHRHREALEGERRGGTVLRPLRHRQAVADHVADRDDLHRPARVAQDGPPQHLDQEAVRMHRAHIDPHQLAAHRPEV
jgi:hypothetical protein